jgi:hypothetical protein
MIVEGKVGYLKHEMAHHDRRGLEHYIAKHNSYSTLEAQEMLRVEQGLGQGTIRYSFWGGPIERRRWFKHKVWPKLPARWLWRWLYMYILRFGFLDGRVGFHFCLFMASYEHQIALKFMELKAGGEGRK